jgi:hypothetical protein
MTVLEGQISYPSINTISAVVNEQMPRSIALLKYVKSTSLSEIIHTLTVITVIILCLVSIFKNVINTTLLLTKYKNSVYFNLF